MAKHPEWAVLMSTARSQDGLFTSAQARAHGVSAGVVRRAAARGAVTAVHRGVWHVDAVPWNWKARQRAAVLGLHGDGCASHAGAAALLGISGIGRGRPEVCRRGVNPPTLVGVRGHASRELEAADLTTVDGIVTTTGSRTLIDLQPRLSRHALIAAIDAAICSGAATRTQLHARACALSAGRALSAIVEVAAPEADGTFWSALERGFGAGIGRSGLPAPQYNVPLRVAGRLLVLDALWAGRNLAVELHGLRFHARPADRMADDERLNLLTLAGIRCLVFTWRDVFERFDHVVATVAGALATAPGQPSAALGVVTR